MRLFFWVVTAWFLSACAGVGNGQNLFQESLEQTKWTLTQLRTHAVSVTSPPTLVVVENGRVRGTDGCNHMGGGFILEANGTVRHLSPGWISTKMACEATRMRLADEYGNALRAAVRWRFDGRDLLLEDKDKVLVLRYRRAD